MKRLVTIIGFCILVFSCKKSQTNTEFDINEKVITMNAVSNYDSIVNVVKTKGDTTAYDELFYYLMDSNESDRIDTTIYYSKIMAEKYHFHDAYEHYLNALLEKYNINYDSDNYTTLDISSLKATDKKQIETWLKKMLEIKIITQEEYKSVKEAV